MTGQFTAFINARLLDPASDTDEFGGLLVEKDLIVAIGADVNRDNLPTPTEIIDCDGMCLAPGLIDSRVFIGEPGAEHKETLATASASAAAGGITTMLMMPDTFPVIDDIALVEYVVRRADDDRNMVNIFPSPMAEMPLPILPSCKES